MKRFFAMMLALMLVLCLTACGGEKKEPEKAVDAIEAAATKYGVTLTAAGEQKMSDERAKMEVLAETRDTWLEGKMTFAFESTPKTYADFVEHIGCDASSYTFVEKNSERHFVWVAEGNESAKLLAVFWETPKGWTLYSIGSTNISK